MCGQFTIPSEDELRAVARAIEYDEPLSIRVAPDGEGDSFILKAYPGRDVPVLLTSVEIPRPLRIKYLSWGYPFDGKRNGAFNTRLETATRIPLWKDSFESRHCVIPVCSFVESSQSETIVSEEMGRVVKQKYLFTNADGGLTLIAGIWKPGYFSMLTTAAHGETSSVKDRMPVVVDVEGAKSWLYEGVLEPSCDVNLDARKAN